MPIEPSAPAAGRRRRWVAGVGGAVAAAVGAVVLVRMIAWFVVDHGLTGTGSALQRPGVAVASMVPAGVALALGIVVVVVARRSSRPGRRTVLGAAAALGGAVLAVVAMGWYPATTTADIVALEPGTGQVAWRASTPATELFGVRSQTAGRVVVEGRIDERGCDFRFVAITLDRGTGAILDVSELPGSYPDPESVPPPPAEPDPSEYVFVQGDPPVTCSR